MIPHRLPLPNITTDRGFLPLNGRRLGHSLVSNKIQKSHGVDISRVHTNVNNALSANYWNGSYTWTLVLQEFFNHCSFPNEAASIISRNPFVLSTK